MKKRILFWAFGLFAGLVSNADNVSVILTDIDEGTAKTRMENMIATVLNEANAAFAEGREIDLGRLHVNNSVATSLSMLWENTPFVCDEESIVEHCLNTSTGYQVRNIALMMRPIGAEKDEDVEPQDAVFDFDRGGNLESFHLTIGQQLYMQVIKSNLELTDLRRRQLILDYVERFRTAYNEKNRAFLQDIFSDDALIITGKVVTGRSKDGIKLPDKVTYKKQTKQEYLRNLFAVFQNNERINVSFDEIEVMRHPTNKDFYGVTLHQGWSSVKRGGQQGYHDDGYLFLLWDFQNEAHPQIHVRTWQPDAYDRTGSGQKTRIPKSEIFNLADFDIE